jgi:hypothetical protein
MLSTHRANDEATIRANRLISKADRRIRYGASHVSPVLERQL